MLNIPTLWLFTVHVISRCIKGKMATSEKFCLKWNDFQKNINTSFGSLRKDEDFSDVTLASEDGKQIEAHKVVLAASSPFFHNMLKKNKHSHPLIYMRGIKSDDLVAIVDFLYYGETNIDQENLDSFLNLAEELNLKGLAGGNEDTINNDARPVTKSPQPKPPSKTSKQGYPKEIEDKYVQNLKSFTSEAEMFDGRALAVSNISFSGELQDLDEHIKSMMVLGQNMTPDGKKKATACQVCGKEGYRTQIRDHIEANHVKGISVPCKLCEKIFR